MRLPTVAWSPGDFSWVNTGKQYLLKTDALQMVRRAVRFVAPAVPQIGLSSPEQQ